MKQRNKRRVFITGASGFVGANIARALITKNYDVHALNRTKHISWRLKDISTSITVHIGDITNILSLKKILKKVKPDYIIHLATYGAYHYQTELEKVIQVNIEGTKNLLEASRDIPYKCFINTGSSSEYGFNNNSMKETDPCNPISYYAATKLASTNICKVFAQINNKPIITLRLFSVFGPYEEPGRFVPTIMKSLIRGENIKITPGNQRRDFVYIDDVSNVYLQILTLGNKIQGEICNIGTGKEYTNDEIVKNLFSIAKKKTQVKKGGYPKRTWDTSHWRANITHTRKILGWKPKYTLDMGLLKTYSWFQKNLHFYV